MIKKLTVLLVVFTMMLTTTAFATASTLTEAVSKDNGGISIDENNVVTVYENDGYYILSQQSRGFGENSASWVTTETPNGYTVKHKAWKEMKSSESLYGVRACCRTKVTDNKNHYSIARMTNAIGTTMTTSGRVYGNGKTYAASPYHDVHRTNACMRSNWGGVY